MFLEAVRSRVVSWPARANGGGGGEAHEAALGKKKKACVQLG